MKYLSAVFVFVLLGCSGRESNPLIGAWYDCTRAGEYRELVIEVNYAFLISTEDEDDPGFYSFKITPDSLIIDGINVQTVKEWNRFSINLLTNDSLIITNVNGDFPFGRVPVSVTPIDSANLNEWMSWVRTNFNRRAADIGCQDLRTEEEKNPVLLELGEVEENFEEIEILED